MSYDYYANEAKIDWDLALNVAILYDALTENGVTPEEADEIINMEMDEECDL